MQEQNYNFEELYNSHVGLVYNLALNYLQNTEDAEEITQDVFVQVHQSITGFKQQASLKTWIYRITLNKCHDHVKAKQSKKRRAFISSLFHEDGGIKHDPGHFDHPGILLENKERTAILFSAINKLPENQKTAFLLSQVEQLSQKEMAESMDLSQKAVESLLQRAKENLRKQLGLMYKERRI